MGLGFGIEGREKVRRVRGKGGGGLMSQRALELMCLMRVPREVMLHQVRAVCEVS